MTRSTYKLVPAIILERQGAVTPFAGGGNMGDPAVITYTAHGFVDLISGSRGNWQVTARKPTRRISAGAKVLVAEPGDPCWIVMVGDNNFLHVTEGVPFVEACP